MTPDPVPYPEHPRLLAAARTQVPRFIDPATLARYQQIVRDRGGDWCTAVLGRPFPGLRHVSAVEACLLALADAENLTPPLPASVTAARDRRATQATEVQRRRAAQRAADQRRWDEALVGAQVPVQVRPNVHGRRYRTGTGEPLRHVVPLVDAHSGTVTRPRLHRAGQAVCETSTRARPRTLGDPVDEPATCVSCVHLTSRLRPAPTSRQGQ